MSRCPECRAPKTEARSFVLERVYNKLTFPCRFSDDGCRYQAKGHQIKSHEDGCEYSTRKCPLRFNNYCKWQGRKLELVLHCKKEHATNIYFEEHKTFKCKDFNTNTSKKYYILFCVYDEIFRCSLDINEEKGNVRFGVYSMNKLRTVMKYIFDLSIMYGDTLKEAVTVRGPCVHLTDDAQRFEKDKYIMFKYNMMKDFCNENGELLYQIKILPVDRLN